MNTDEVNDPEQIKPVQKKQKTTTTTIVIKKNKPIFKPIENDSSLEMIS